MNKNWHLLFFPSVVYSTNFKLSSNYGAFCIANFHLTFTYVDARRIFPELTAAIKCATLPKTDGIYTEKYASYFSNKKNRVAKFLGIAKFSLHYFANFYQRKLKEDCFIYTLLFPTN
jgi:hypothetical protein